MTETQILIVEDESVIAMETEINLKNLGYHVTSVVNNGKDAIKRAEEDNPDLILMDIRIHGNMDGIETAEYIRNRFKIPVIFTTAYLDQERIERAKITMPFGYILKPIQQRDLKVTLDMALYVSKLDTKRREAEQKLQEREENLRTTLKSIGDAVITTDTQGNISNMNPVAEKLTGWKLAEAMGRPLDEVFNIINSQTREKATNPAVLVLEKGSVVGLANHTMLIAKDGSEYQIADSGSPIRDAHGNISGVVLVFRDVTEEYEMREKIVANEKQLKQLYESMTEGICQHELVYDDSAKVVDYRILDANPQYEKILQLDKKQIVGKLATEAYQTETAPYIETYAAVAETGNPIRFETYFPPMNRHFSISVFSPDKGKFATIFEDITQRKHAEEKLLESEKRHRILFETMPVGVIYQDAEGRITDANPSAERILGLSLDQMKGRTSIDPRWKSIHEDGSDFPGDVHPAMIALKTGEKVSNVIMGVFHPEKEAYRWINITAVPKFREGESKPYEVYATFYEITDTKTGNGN